MTGLATIPKFWSDDGTVGGYDDGANELPFLTEGLFEFINAYREVSHVVGQLLEQYFVGIRFLEDLQYISNFSFNAI